MKKKCTMKYSRIRASGQTAHHIEQLHGGSSCCIGKTAL
jgi:hypothetical protein